MALQPATERTRAWLLITVERPKDASEALTPLFIQGGDSYVVVRADVISGQQWNLVVPVDAASPDGLLEAKNEITKILGADANISEATATHHNETPPHKAHGYITEQEYAQDPDEAFKGPGRQGSSPGRNPWG